MERTGLLSLLAKGLFFMCALLSLVASILFLFSVSERATASPLAQATATPTCPTPGCAPTPVPKYYGHQPRRYDLRVTFNTAAANAQGDPTHSQIAHGLPPAYGGSGITYIDVSPSQPIPHVILRGMAWQESRWKQFADDIYTDPDDADFCTYVAPDCGYGIMQITWCITHPSDSSCGWMDKNQVSQSLEYNLRAGTNWLIGRWNATDNPFIGDNDHTVPEDWYYAVTAYNGWGPGNNPNRSGLDPGRSPFDGTQPDPSLHYPYEELTWGWVAHPESAPAGSHWLWRQTHIAWVPRGVWGDPQQGEDWHPPTWTPQPLFHLLSGIRVTNSVGPTIVLHNTTDKTLAADVALYNDNHTFSRWWLDTTADPRYAPYYRIPYIRLNAYSSRMLAVADVFPPGESFTGYARVSASEGVKVTLQPPPYPNKVFLPLALKNHGGNCYNEVWNGGFEEFVDGKPRYWTVSSADAYPLADSTWFASGHYGAYLGGYDRWESDDDKLSQSIYIPSDALAANLTYRWYMRTEETHPSNQYDFLRVQLRDPSDNLVATLDTVSNQSPRDTWQTAMFDLLPYAGQSLKLSLEADNDVSNPTSFFVDDVSLWICRP